MWAILLLSVFVAGQDQPPTSVCPENFGENIRFIEDGDDKYISAACNYVGVCYEWNDNGIYYCECRNEVDGNTAIASILPKAIEAIQGVYSGFNCETIRRYTQITFGYVIISNGQLTCANDGISTAVPDLLDVTREILQEYPGSIVTQPCKICTKSDPCELQTTVTSGVYVEFATDINTFYDLGCEEAILPGASVRACDAVYDYGADAVLKMRELTDYANNHESILSSASDTIDASEFFTQPWELNGWHVEELVFQVGHSRTEPVTLSPTRYPSDPPTRKPTKGYREAPSECTKFSHPVSSLQFLEAGTSCRANINEEWPGGRTCESPYIICLPEENTPAGEFLGREYKSSTHRYNVVECTQECAFDQRCLGFEFVPDLNSDRGDCNLIDDIPIRAVDVDNEVEYNEDDVYDSLDGNAACFHKYDYCNPHFTSEQLNDTMLACYCPNNRKGSYTKKVKRTVNNTRSCEGDYSMDERIRYAQANRMFHLCENWCLFNALNPELESWYWDPWKSCWRETYSADGEHRGYCDRVIRNPNSIELKFVNARSENLLSPDCDATRTPTEPPVDNGETTYYLGEDLESCDDACSRNNLTCAADQTARRFSTETELIEAFAEAGHSCDADRVMMNNTMWQGWALPGLRRGVCANRPHTIGHLQDLDSDCHRIIGASWQRLCACY